MSASNAVPSSAKDFFLHLLATITLYMGVYSLIRLLFSYINVLFPDALSFYYMGELDSIRFSTAMLFVAFPVYVLMSWMINKDIAKNHEKAAIPIRRWLVYLTIFLAALIIIGDVIALMYNFLNGELSVRFYLKVAVVLFVALAVFGYYLWDVREHAALHWNRMRQYAMTAGGAVALSIVAGFFIAGTPWYQRQVRFDERRVQDLSMLQSQIQSYWMSKDRLPASLDDLRNDLQGFIPPVDPESGDNYAYRATGPLAFELCADFKTASPQLPDVKGMSRPAYPYEPYSQVWEHGEGRTCFTRTIDPELYPDKPLVR